MAARRSPERPTVRVGENSTGGRDFVVGDVHGEFEALDATLASLGLQPTRERLFALGDLIDRGPRGADALAWMESGRIVLSVRGNHEQMLLERIEGAESDPGERVPWRMQRWFMCDVARAYWARWKAMIQTMPIAATVRTRTGAVGLVHATPTARHWDTMLGKLAAGDTDTMWTSMNSTARAHHDARRAARRAEHERIPLDGHIDGVHAVLTGHTILGNVARTGNVWHIDTGAGFANGRLTLARIDTDPIETVTVPIG